LIAPAGAAITPSALSVAIACPAPLALVVKIPGSADATCTVCGEEDPALVVTTTFTTALVLPSASTSHGTCALICPEETKYNGARTLSKVTEVTLPSVVGSGTELALTG
jgi:hypothetical protein